MKRFIDLLALAMILSLTGCYSGYKMTKAPQMSEDVAIHSNNGEKIPLHVSSITVKDKNLAAGFEGRLLSRLNKTSIYKDVTYGVYSRRPEGRYIDASLSIDENSDGNTSGNAAKGFFIGFTFFTLTPVLPLTADFSSVYDLAVVWPNGVRKSYQAVCAAHAYGTLFQAQSAFTTASGEIADKCLNSLVNQMSADYHLMADSSSSTSISSIGSEGSLKASSGASPIEYAKEKCSSLGFKEKTSDFGSCVMQLISQ